MQALLPAGHHASHGATLNGHWREISSGMVGLTPEVCHPRLPFEAMLLFKKDDEAGGVVIRDTEADVVVVIGSVPACAPVHGQVNEGAHHH